jgi:hypothetical protein
MGTLSKSRDMFFWVKFRAISLACLQSLSLWRKKKANQAKVLRSSRRRILPEGVLGTASTK